MVVLYRNRAVTDIDLDARHKQRYKPNLVPLSHGLFGWCSLLVWWLACWPQKAEARL